jgi:hypothetical protein
MRSLLVMAASFEGLSERRHRLKTRDTTTTRTGTITTGTRLDGVPLTILATLSAPMITANGGFSGWMVGFPTFSERGFLRLAFRLEMFRKHEEAVSSRQVDHPHNREVYSSGVIRSRDVAMQSEGSKDIYRKGKIECLWLALLQIVSFFCYNRLNVLSTKAQGHSSCTI